jgi:hypothetical protein
MMTMVTMFTLDAIATLTALTALTTFATLTMREGRDPGGHSEQEHRHRCESQDCLFHLTHSFCPSNLRVIASVASSTELESSRENDGQDGVRGFADSKQVLLIRFT